MCAVCSVPNEARYQARNKTTGRYTAVTEHIQVQTLLVVVGRLR